MWMWIGAPCANASTSQLVERHGAQAVRRHAHHGIGQGSGMAARGIEQAGKAIEIVQEPRLPGAGRLPAKPGMAVEHGQSVRPMPLSCAATTAALICAGSA
jgi:hypothetical protein